MSDMLEKYEIGVPIGKGTHGIVYNVRNIETKKIYALKVIKKKRTRIDNDEIRKELFLHSQLNHPNIIKLVDSSEDDDNFYIILELCGEDLFKYMKEKGYVEEDEAINIIYQIFLAVKYLHSNNITHRDIKLENIVKCDTLWKLADFGNADEEKIFTQTVGTLDYLAPEIVSYEKYKGFPVDIWTLGITFYDLLFSHPPFLEKTYKATYNAILNNQPSFSERKINPLLKNLIELMLIKNPEKRINIDQVLEHPVFNNKHYINNYF